MICVGTLCGRFQKELVIVQRIVNKREEEKRNEARQTVIRIVRSIHEKHQQQKGKEGKATQEFTIVFILEGLYTT
jgi:hypothetical protein